MRDAAPRPLERVMATMMRQRVVVCNRCGWRGRVPIRSASSPGGERRRRHREHREEPITTLPRGEIDLAQIDKALERTSKE